MFNLLFMLSRFVMVPYDLITGPFRASNSIMMDSARGRAMMLGLPAVIIALLGTGTIVWAGWGNQEALENDYKKRAEKASEEKVRLINEINMETRLSAARNRNSAESTTIDENDPRMLKLRELNEEEEIYLEKLIWLNPEDPDYRYRLALVSLNKNPQKCFSLMRSIAPDNEPGFAKAHLWMASNLVKQKPKSGAQAREIQRLALLHAEHCLVRENDNPEAMLLKAQLLMADKQYNEAYEMYRELFTDYPGFYKQLIEINKILGGSYVSENAVILDQAELRFKEKVDEAAEDYNPTWATAWIELVQCMRAKEDYQAIANLLSQEEEKQRKLSAAEGTPEAASRHVHIKQLLTTCYTFWAAAVGNETLDTEREQLDLLKKALKLDMNNPRALQLIARISAGNSPLAEEAKRVYDPEKHDDAPSQVLNEMGSKALLNEQYDRAIKYFELARRKSPDDPQILNNLAYTYLVCENKNPDRALTLVNQAIRRVQQIPSKKQQLELISHFRDTQGRALMQMNRMDEAAAALEMAAQLRPENQKILEALIQCYEGRDNLQADIYRRRLERLREKGNENVDEQAGGQ